MPNNDVGSSNDSNKILSADVCAKFDVLDMLQVTLSFQNNLKTM